MSFFVLKDLDWSWDDQCEGRAIVVYADTPEAAIREATTIHLNQQQPGAGGVTWEVASLNSIGFADVAWESDNVPKQEPITFYEASQAGADSELPLDRETLGRMVREAWVRWAQTQPAPKPSWLVPYDELSEPDKEADRQIGEAIAKWTVIHYEARAAIASLAEPVAWLDLRREPADDWTKRVVATNPEFVANNGPENFAPLVYASSLPQAGAGSELVERVDLQSMLNAIDDVVVLSTRNSPFSQPLVEAVLTKCRAALTHLHTRLATAEAENKRWQDNWDANVQEMSEKFRAVNIAKVIEATGADIFALRDRAEAKLAEALTKLERADEGLANAYSATYNDYDRDRLACERIGLQKGIAILRSSIAEKTTPKESN